MPQFESIRRQSILGPHTPSALLVLVLAGLVVSLFAIGVPKASAGDDHTAPSAPTNLRVLAATQTSVTVAWDASTDDVGVEGYKVYFGKPRPERTPETLFTATDLSCGNTYKVEVRAYDQAKNASWATKAFVSTAPCVDVQPPSPPTGLQQVAGSPTTATLSWSASSDNVAVAGYAVSRGGIELGTTAERSYAFSGLSCSQTYAVGVRAYDVAGNSSAWVAFYVATSKCGDVSPPTTPSGLVQTDRSATSMSIAWAHSTDNIGVAHYDVFRGGSQVGSTAGLSYALSGLTCGTSHVVGVEAVDGAGNHSSRSSATMSTASCVVPPPPSGDTQPPSTPANLAVAVASPTSVTLTWAPSTDNVAVTGYGAFDNGVRVQVVTGTTFVFQGLACGTSHQLGVEAYDAAGNQSARPVVTAATSPCTDPIPPTTPQNPALLSRTSSSVTLSWSASTDNVAVAGYGAYVDGQFAGSTTATSYTFTGLACNTSRIFGVDAYDAAGNRSGRSLIELSTTACNDTQPPTAPSQLSVSNPTQTSLTLSWAASSDSGGVAGYDVFVNGVKSATVTATSRTLSGLTCDAVYALGVEAFDGAGNRSARTITTASTAECFSPLPPPPSGATVFVSPSGNDGSACTQAAPCKSFDRAYSLAQPGQTVSVAAGSYGFQVLSYRGALANLSPGCTPSATQNCVTFVPQGGVTVDGLEIHGSSVYFKGPVPGGNVKDWRTFSYSWRMLSRTTVEADSSTQYPDHIVLEGIDTAVLGTYSSDSVYVRGADVGPGWVDAVGGSCTGDENKIAWNGIAMPKQPTNVTWDRVYIHDQNRTQAAANADCHTGGLFIVTGDGIAIRNSVFEQNVVYNIQVQNFGGSPVPRNVTIENNWFGCAVENSYTPNGVNLCDGQASIQFNAASTFSGWTIRYNSFARGAASWANGGEASFSGVAFVGNVGERPSGDVCGRPGVSFAKNAWIGGACGGSDKSIVNPFVRDLVGAEDLHLVAGSGAIDAGDPSNLPSSDIDGQARPIGGGPDAGADESS